MRAAVLSDTDLVINIIEVGCLDDFPDLPMTEAGQGCEIGALYDRLTNTFFPPKPPIIGIEEFRVGVVKKADSIARQKRDMVVAGISPAEMASWPIKRAEALAYQSTGAESAAPSLALEAQARGVAIADLAGKVLAKAAQLAALEAGIAGRCGAIQDAAAAAQSDAELLAIDLEAGWPV